MGTLFIHIESESSILRYLDTELLLFIIFRFIFLLEKCLKLFHTAFSYVIVTYLRDSIKPHFQNFLIRTVKFLAKVTDFK